MSIRLLDSFLTTQIAAGEVIERPASVIKELLENSLDAKATRLEVEIGNSVCELIRVTDDGVGINKADLPLAIQRYATSKIASLDDLERVLTFGFRGEALASISSVARFCLASRIRDAESGWKIITEGNSSAEVMPTAHPFGTSIEVRDLFFNTPVRRKFLRSEKTEFRKIEEIVNLMALARFDVGFLLKHGNKIVFNLPSANGDEEKRARVAEICGKEFIDNSHYIESERSGFKLTGWINKPTFSRSQSDLQYFYINGRIVRDKLLIHAMRQAYHDVLASGRQPAYVLYLEMDPQLVDVNVHPTKMEVRFRDSQSLYAFLVFSIKQTLAKPIMEAGAGDRIVDAYIKENFQPSFLHKSVSRDFSADTNVSVAPIPKQIELPLAIAEESPVYQAVNIAAKNSPDANEKIQEPISNYLGYALAQLDARYILAQNKNGLVIVDVHAAHERINYEKLKTAYVDKILQVQDLLIPITIQLGKKEYAVAEEYQDEFKKFGLEIEFIDSDSIVVRSLPAIVSGSDSRQFIFDILADLSEFSVSTKANDYTDKILATFACHHSVRGRTKLSIDEMNALLRQIEITERSGQCNHGRPTWTEIPFDKIGKMFV